MSARTTTLLFTDIVASTEMFGGLESRQAERLRCSHFDSLRAHVVRRGGCVVKTLGDGLMATFDTARGAIEAGVAIQREAAGAAPRAPEVRVGISSGDVQLSGEDCFGTPVVEASRLCALAKGGQVLVAQATRLLVRDYTAITEVGDVRLKGLPELTTVWEAYWTASTPAPVRAVLADDAVLVREGIAHVLEAAGIEVVGQASDGDELLRLVAELHPDIAIVDIRMPPAYATEGLVAAERIRAEHPGTATLVLSQELQPRYAARLLAGGATGIGYLLKEHVGDLRAFVEATRRVAAGGTAFEPALMASPRASQTPEQAT